VSKQNWPPELQNSLIERATGLLNEIEDLGFVSPDAMMSLQDAVRDILDHISGHAKEAGREPPPLTYNDIRTLLRGQDPDEPSGWTQESS